MFRYVADEFNKLFKRSPDPISREQRITNKIDDLHYNNTNHNRHKSTYVTSPDLNNNNFLDISRRQNNKRINSANTSSKPLTATTTTNQHNNSYIPVNSKNEPKYFHRNNQNSDFDQIDWFSPFRSSSKNLYR